MAETYAFGEEQYFIHGQRALAIIASDVAYYKQNNRLN